MEYVRLLPPNRGSGGGSGIGSTIEHYVLWSLNNRASVALAVVAVIGAWLLVRALVRP